ncbi:hypothetical protein ACFV90_36860 [Streptomyces sp. NPDC059904]|uniref:hypothetical protein n=1 Tax=Streptomyces sp. NPDC059904 TaxID=3346996 RepID=UPI00365AF2D4
MINQVPDETFYDVLPDGTLGDPIDFSDGEAVAKLLYKRMSPENFALLSVELVKHGYRRDPKATLQMLAKQRPEVSHAMLAAIAVDQQNSGA